MSGNQTTMDDKTLFVKMQTQLEKADAERLAQNWKEANKLLKQALDELGHRYFRENVRDDSGYKLIIEADIPEREGKINDAVRVRRRILANRLELLRGKIIDNQPIMDDKTLFIKIKAQIEKADAEIETQNWKEANELLKQALVELGLRYNSGPYKLDDTGVKLVTAMIHEEEGNLDNAARDRRRILAERLEMFKNKVK